MGERGLDATWALLREESFSERDCWESESLLLLLSLRVPLLLSRSRL